MKQSSAAPVTDARNCEVADFAERVIAGMADRVVSFMSYPHPFSAGGFLIVVPDDVDSLLACVADVYRCLPPLKKTMHVLRPSELSQLGLPGLHTWPVFVNERPHLPYLLRHKSELLYGADIREQLPKPCAPRLALDQHVEACKLHLRSQGLLRWLAERDYALLFRQLDFHFRYLMATALLQFEHWDVEFESAPEHFKTHFAHHPSIKTWHNFHSIARTTGDSRPAALEAAWLFECFLRQIAV